MASFTSPIPKEWAEDPEKAAFLRDLVFLLNDLVAPDGVISTVDTTTQTVLTQGEKLDLITISQAVDLDSVEADTASNKTAVEAIYTGSPTYSISNDGTDRTFNADAAAGAISVSPSQAEVENIQSAVLELADVVATVIRDLKNKGVFGV